MASGETKTWLTPKRIARGPEKADEEIRRWAKGAFRPAKIYGSVSAMRADALASRAAGVGSRRIARVPKPVVTPLELAALAGISVGAFFVGRWIGKRRHQPQAVHGAPENPYLIGALALCA
jgi:hypothetical protein